MRLRGWLGATSVLGKLVVVCSGNVSRWLLVAGWLFHPVQWRTRAATVIKELHYLEKPLAYKISLVSAIDVYCAKCWCRASDQTQMAERATGSSSRVLNTLDI